MFTRENQVKQVLVFHKVLHSDQSFSHCTCFPEETIWQQGINFHCYLNDTQLYLSMKPEEAEQLVSLG